MEANECEMFHQDSDVLLPPRKRLLAGLKRRNSESTLKGSVSPESSSSTPWSEYDARLHKLLKSYKNGCHMSPEEIVEAAGSAAAAAAKAAEAARAAAEEKAAIAVKAVADAKAAMSLATTFSVGALAGVRERQSRKNKLKKHVPVQHLYMKPQTDEELAHKLHRVINSSPRTLHQTLGSESHIKRKFKISPREESNGFPNAMVVENGNSQCVVVNEVEDIDSHGSYTKKLSRSSKSDPAVEISGEVESGHSTENLLESPDVMHVNGRRRGRNKLKKMPLSSFSLKDRVNPKDDLKEGGSSDKLVLSAEAHTNTLVSVEHLSQHRHGNTRILKFPSALNQIKLCNPCTNTEI